MVKTDRLNIRLTSAERHEILFLQGLTGMTKTELVLLALKNLKKGILKNG